MKHTFKSNLSALARLAVLAAFFLSAWAPLPVPLAQAENPQPPEHTVKLIFIHHSSGENWLRDDNGGLGRALGENNYFVSDTNYGWGPDSIGDRTDIPNWLEWFRSENTGRIMQAVFKESGQNSEYTRTLSDPGGENEIILFKSCFPNSSLEGQPDDPPTPGSDLTVGNAKYIYNEILKYFATRPDKLFIVITAPPNSDSDLAANARAFNNWLMNDWLRQNNYTLANVAVFDFYNVLTGPDNHHRFKDGKIEHVTQPGKNSAYYRSASDDDHPSAKGNRKATEEFVPLLNIFYHRWKASAPAQPTTAENTAPAPQVTEVANAPEAPAPGSAGLLASFEGRPDNLASYSDETTVTKIHCAPSDEVAYAGVSALKIEFEVAAGSWSTCALSYDSTQDWSSGQGLAFYLRASRAGLPYNVILYVGPPDRQETYLFHATTPPGSVGGWALVEIPWSEFRRADWEADPGTVFEKQKQVAGMAFGIDGLAEAANAGTLWVDNLQLSNEEVSTEQPTSSQATEAIPPTDQPTVPQSGGGSSLPCLGGALAPGMLLLAWLLSRALR